MDKKNDVFQQIPMKLIKGRYTPFETSKGIVNIKHIYTFDSHRKLYSHILFQTQEMTFLGIICARHTSDLLNILLKKLLSKKNKEGKPESPKSNGLFIIQYALPSERSCFKLILLKEIQDIAQFDTIQQELRQFLDAFLERLHKITDKLLNEE